MAKHGSQQLIHLNNTEIVEAYAFTWSLAGSEVDVSDFGSTHIKRIRGLRDITGSISVWHHQDKQYILTYANTRQTYPLHWYPDRTDNTTFISQNVFLDCEYSGDMGSAISITAAWRADGAATVTGFS